MYLIEIDRQYCLSSLKKEEGAVLFALVEANRGHLRRFLNWVDGVKSAEDIVKFIEREHEKEEGKKFPHALAIRYSGDIVGVCGFDALDTDNSSVEIGYWLDQSYQGKGIVTSSVRRLIKYAFDSSIHRIEIRCLTANKKSRSVIERVGGQFEGVKRSSLWLYDRWEDQLVFSIISKK